MVWAALGLGAVLIVADVVLRRRGVIKDRSREVGRQWMVSAVVFLVLGVAVLVG